MAKTKRAVAPTRKRQSGASPRKVISQESLIPNWIAGPAESVTDWVTEVSKLVTQSLETAGTTVLDLNNDGRVDQKDVRLLTKNLQKVAAEIVNSEPMKSAAKAAAVGSVIAVPIPLVGPAGGAATAVVVYFTYKGAEGLVRAAGEPFAKRRPAKAPKKKVGVRRVVPKAGSTRRRAMRT